MTVNIKRLRKILDSLTYDSGNLRSREELRARALKMFDEGADYEVEVKDTNGKVIATHGPFQTLVEADTAVLHFGGEVKTIAPAAGAPDTFASDKSPARPHKSK